MLKYNYNIKTNMDAEILENENYSGCHMQIRLNGISEEENEYLTHKYTNWFSRLGFSSCSSIPIFIPRKTIRSVSAPSYIDFGIDIELFDSNNNKIPYTIRKCSVISDISIELIDYIRDNNLLQVFTHLSVEDSFAESTDSVVLHQGEHYFNIIPHIHIQHIEFL